MKKIAFFMVILVTLMLSVTASASKTVRTAEIELYYKTEFFEGGVSKYMDTCCGRFKLTESPKDKKIVITTYWDDTICDWMAEVTEGAEYISGSTKTKVGLTYYNLEGVTWERTFTGTEMKRGNIKLKAEKIPTRVDGKFTVYTFTEDGELVYVNNDYYGMYGRHDYEFVQDANAPFLSLTKVSIRVTENGVEPSVVCMVAKKIQDNPAYYPPVENRVTFVGSVDTKNGFYIPQMLIDALCGQKELVLPTVDGDIVIPLDDITDVEEGVYLDSELNIVEK